MSCKNDYRVETMIMAIGVLASAGIMILPAAVFYYYDIQVLIQIPITLGWAYLVMDWLRDMSKT